MLKLMNRKHTRQSYLEIIEKIREARCDIAISSDFIVGFPGETDSDFEQSLSLINKVKMMQDGKGENEIFYIIKIYRL